MRSPVLLLLGAALLVAASHAAWEPVADVRGMVIQQVGRFAVIVYDLAQRKELTYGGVVRGETQQAVGGGTNYKLVVVMSKPDGSTAQYECLVWGVPGSRSDTWKLRRFRKIQS